MLTKNKRKKLVTTNKRKALIKCRGLGSPTSVHVLVDLIHTRKPDVVFIMETMVASQRLEPIKVKMGFEGMFAVDSNGLSGGLVCFWKKGPMVSIKSYSPRHIDMVIKEEGNCEDWRLTGFYRVPDRNQRSVGWNLLKSLAGQSNLPWAVLGDFNDILHATEKKGGNPQPSWLLDGFRDAVEQSGLSDFAFEGHQFTWEKSRGKPGWVQAKLDRVLVSDDWNERFRGAKAQSIISSRSDHLPILLHVDREQARQYPKRFKFENLWLKETCWREIVIESWNQSKGMDLSDRIYRCTTEVWRWGKVFTTNFRRRINFWERRMELLKRRSDDYGCSLFRESQFQHQRAIEHQNIYRKQRAKEFWLKAGDQNTTFFHNSVRKRRINNHIPRLKNENGEWEEKGPALNNLMIRYFQNLFTAQSGESHLVTNCLEKKVNQSQNDRLLRRFSNEELKIALYDMKPDKSPGPDGLTPGFFQHFWDIVGDDVVSFCESFRLSNTLPAGSNSTHLVLIPKISKPSTMGDLRPIALCNVLYKILAKAIANRIKPFLNDLISDAQCAFVPGRLITDNLLLAHETQHFLNRKTQGKVGFVGMKLDMSKAYDRVSWKLVEDVLLKLGFDANFVALISACISSVEFCIIQEGQQLGPIIPQRGLRQGDPLSPYLFILIMEGLSALIRKETSTGRMHGISVARGAPELTHLFFADDCFLFCRANSLEVRNMKETLAEFSAASGQAINFNKSSTFFSRNVDSITREVISDIMGIPEGVTTGKYLGLPSLIGRRKIEIMGFIKNKVVGRINSWNNKFLSKVGREVLIKNVLQAIPAYAMSIFLLPQDLCSKIETALNGFWWNSSQVEGKGIRWKRWSDLCQPKSVGGMGFRKIREFNLSLLGKQAWRFIKHPDSLVSKVYKARYFKDSSFLTTTLGSNPSFVWRSIMEAQTIISANCMWRVGNGTTIDVWNYPWLPRQGDPFVQTPAPLQLRGIKVVSLMNMQKDN